jgi:lysozyme
MTEKPELLATAKTLPPWIALGVEKLMGLSLNDWVLISALIYTLLQILVLVRDKIINRRCLVDGYDGVDRRQRDDPVEIDRRQRGAINRQLVAGMSVASLVAALAAGVATWEGNGPTSISPSGQTVHHAYPDPSLGWGKPTICQGRTMGVFPGMTATAEQCQLWLAQELSDGVVRSLAAHVKTPVTQRQAVALGLFRDNVGEGNFRASRLLREVNAGRCVAAANEFNASPQINRATGQPIVWRRKPIIDRQTGKVLLATGAPIMKWTTAGGVPLPGLIKRRGEERAMFEADCPAWGKP